MTCFGVGHSSAIRRRMALWCCRTVIGSPVQADASPWRQAAVLQLVLLLKRETNSHGYNIDSSVFTNRTCNIAVAIKACFHIDKVANVERQAYWDAG